MFLEIEIFKRSNKCIALGLGPITFKHLGYIGCYLTTAIGGSMAILYLVFYIKEPVERHPNISNDSRPFMKKFLIDPVKSMFSTLTKPREGHLRGLLLLQIFTYGLIWFNYQLSTQEYLYMLKMFKSYDENQYAYYTAIKNSLISFFMVVFFPFIKIHESMYCILGKLIVPIKPTGCSDKKLSKVNGCKTETVHF